jgi:hypothetical protein
MNMDEVLFYMYLFALILLYLSITCYYYSIKNMWKHKIVRLSVYRNCVAICTDGSCDNVYKNTTSFLELCPFEIHTFLDKVDRGPETEQEGAGKDMTSDMVDVEDEDQYFEMEYNEVSKAENVVQQMEDDDWEMEDDDLEMEDDDLERDEDKWEMDKEYDTEELDFDPLNSNKQKVTYDETRTAQHYNQLEDMVIQHFLKIDIDNVTFES